MPRAPEGFAPQYPREEHGWIQFPRDIELRRSRFPSKETMAQFPDRVHYDVFDHPAKMNLFLVEALVNYISKPGDWIVEPFGGTGSTCWAAPMNRNVCIMDIEPGFVEIIKETAQLLVPGGAALDMPNHSFGFPVWEWMAPTGAGSIRVTTGDNRKVLPKQPQTFQACITSPPYSTALKPGSNPLEVHGREGTLLNYTRSPANLGNLNPFFWEQAMRDVWKGLFQCMLPGGIVAMVNKDMFKSGQRELLSTALIDQGDKAGFQYVEWRKWDTPDTIRTQTAKNKGGNVIEDEDIIFFERRAG